MAKFTSYYNLCFIQDPKEFLGLSKDRIEGNVITTLGRNVVIITNLITQENVENWTVLDKLSSKVIYDKKSDKYVGIFRNQYIRCWNASVKDINKIKKIKLNKPISNIVWSEDVETIVLYTDGTIATLSAALSSGNETEEPKRALTELGQQILHPIIFTSSNRNILTYFVKHRKSGLVELVVVTLNGPELDLNESMRKFSLSRPNQDVELTGYAVIESDNNPSLFTIWSDKRIFLMPLREGITNNETPGNFVSILTALKADVPISVASISKDCVALYGANLNQEGSSLVLYNRKLKFIKAKQFFKVYFKVSNIWVVDDHILLVMGQNLSVLTYCVSKELLSDIIGSQNSQGPFKLIGKDFINEDEEIEESLEYVQSKETKTKLMYIEGSSDEGIQANGNNIPYETYDNFDDQLRYLCRNKIELNIFTHTNGGEEPKIELLLNNNTKAFNIAELNIIANDLERHGASEEEITEKLIPLLIKSDLIDEIIICLRKYSSVPDKVLAKILSYILPEELIEDTQSENEGLSFTKNEELINATLSCSINIDSILIFIKKELTFKQVVVLINHLYKLISHHDICLEERIETSYEFDDYTKIFQWLSVLLDTQYQSLVLVRDNKVINVLLKWQSLLSSFMNNFDILNDLYSTICSFINGTFDCKDKKYSKWYSIEEIQLY